MADEIFIINLIAENGETIEKQEEFPETPNWLMFTGSFDIMCEIQLAWETSFGNTFKSSGIYYVKTGDTVTGSRVIVDALVENARGSDGEDFIQGNEVSNIIYGDFATDGIGGDDILWGAAGTDQIFGGEGQDEVAGGEDNDVLEGNDGADRINGDSGIDLIDGGAGADELSGGSDIGDTVTYSKSDAGVTVKITFGETTIGSGGDAAGDTVRGFTGVIGSAFDDTITDTVSYTIAFGNNGNVFDGREGDDTLILGGGNDKGFGGDGDDEILGGRGNDQIEGEVGNDYCDGGSGRDNLAGLDGNDVLLGRAGDDRLSGGENDDRLLGGDGADNLSGLDGADLLRGEDGNDTLRGGFGMDRLIGGTGKDLLTGGLDADVFVFTSASDSGFGAATRDIITDFDRSEGDMIDLSGIDADPVKAGNNAFEFMGAAGFSGLRGELRLVDDTDGVIILLNLDTDLTAEFAIFVKDVLSVREGDLVL